MTKVSYFLTIIIGGGLILFGQLMFGVIAMIVGLFITLMTEEEIRQEYSFEQEQEKPYYKDEFEEYQHFKIVNKGMYGKQVERRIKGEEGFNTPDKDCGLFTHEKRSIELREYKK